MGSARTARDRRHGQQDEHGLQDQRDELEHVDVLVVGAGLSGIGVAAQLRRRCPERSVAVLEARAESGGTWSLFRYPGVRSDSDMWTFGYSFRPWTSGAALTDGASVLEYLRATAREEGVEELVRYRHRVVAGDFDSARARWRVRVERPRAGRGGGVERVELTCSFLVACTGYYRYDRGHDAALPGVGDFTGAVVHPQHWPAELDVRGARVVVVGSGATAVTLVPALARAGAEHVTMLQRSPSWVVSLPSRDRLAERLAGRAPARLAHAVLRAKHVLLARAGYRLARRHPARVAAHLRRAVAAQVPASVDVDVDFTPRYDPWDQRVCFVPDGDLFAALRAGSASVVTAAVERVTATGVRLAGGAQDGRELPADVLVTATGLELLVLGGVELRVDGDRVDVPGTVAYKGMMLSGVPNLVLALGYTNASWTLKVDLVAVHLARLLRRMAARGQDAVVPLPPPTDERAPLIDLQAGYVRRGLALLPRQGVRAPWRLHQDYLRDWLLLRWGPVADAGLRFSRAGAER